MKREKRYSLFKLILAFSLIVTIFQGCNSVENKNPLAEYEKKIKDYYSEKLNDPKSYEAIKTDVLYSNDVTKVLKHSFRAKNSYNALIKRTSYFIIKENSIPFEVDDAFYSTFNDLVNKKVIGSESYDIDPFFLSIGMNREFIYYNLNNNNIKNKEEYIHRICKVISELENHERNKERIILGSYYGLRYVNLFDSIRLFPNEMAAILIDSY